MSRRSDPDPLDPNDPRVLLEWKDRLGQTIRPGDYVAYNASGFGIGQVKLIQALRKDGRPFVNKGPHLVIHVVHRSTMELGYWTPNDMTWDKYSRAWVKMVPPPADLPSLYQESHPMDNIFKIDWKPESERNV